jgi:hypothetical protein
MADPVLVDGGGSMRIREMSATNKMDGLLDGKANANNAANKKYDTLRVEHHFKDGTNHLHPSGLGTTPLASGDVIVITSASGHKVQMTVKGAGALVLEIDLTTGNPPIVEAKTQLGQRIYRITNADEIQLVEKNGVTVFDNSTGPNVPSALTVVAIL